MPPRAGGDVHRRESPVHLGSIGVPAAAGERLLTGPAFIVMKAADEFRDKITHPTSSARPTSRT